jgi:hypothetical protein
VSKQVLMFDNATDNTEQKYSKKVEAPVYEPRHVKPHLLLLCDQTKTRQLVREIDESSLPEDEKVFLRAAAWRHAVFHYERIADYYAHSGPEFQRLAERSALVIVDFDAAIAGGFVKVCEEVQEQFLEEYHGDANPS